MSPTTRGVVKIMKCKNKYFAEVTEWLKQIVVMGSQLMLGGMMSIMPDKTNFYASKEKKFVQAWVQINNTLIILPP